MSNLNKSAASVLAVTALLAMVQSSSAEVTTHSGCYATAIDWCNANHGRRTASQCLKAKLDYCDDNFAHSTSGGPLGLRTEPSRAKY